MVERRGSLTVVVLVFSLGFYERVEDFLAGAEAGVFQDLLDEHVADDGADEGLSFLRVDE